MWCTQQSPIPRLVRHCHSSGNPGRAPYRVRLAFRGRSSQPRIPRPPTPPLAPSGVSPPHPPPPRTCSFLPAATRNPSQRNQRQPDKQADTGDQLTRHGQRDTGRQAGSWFRGFQVPEPPLFVPCCHPIAPGLEGLAATSCLVPHPPILPDPSSLSPTPCGCLSMPCRTQTPAGPLLNPGSGALSSETTTEDRTCSLPISCSSLSGIALLSPSLLMASTFSQQQFHSPSPLLPTKGPRRVFLLRRPQGGLTSPPFLPLPRWPMTELWTSRGSSRVGARSGLSVGSASGRAVLRHDGPW